ncbi:MAG: DUF2752 domain-containing protein [Cytophagaceae bacterium]
MNAGRNNLYLLLSAACIAGYIWLTLVMFHNTTPTHSDFTLCPVKNVTGIPCPSCGSTRAALSFLKGNTLGSIAINPIGIIGILIMGITPFWISYDLLLNKNSLHSFYNKTEIFLRRRYIAIPLIFLVLCNWIWNIYKGL